MQLKEQYLFIEYYMQLEERYLSKKYATGRTITFQRKWKLKNNTFSKIIKLEDQLLSKNLQLEEQYLFKEYAAGRKKTSLRQRETQELFFGSRK